MDPATASLIVGATQAASSVGTNVANYQLYKKQRADNRQDAATAYQRSIDMWNMNNAYNDPSAQMERLKQAGLNPNLVYGGGATTTASAPSAPQASSATPQRFQGVDALPALSMYMDVKMKQAQADLIEEQKNNVIQRTANERTDNLLKTLDLDYFGTRNRRSLVELNNIEQYQSNAMELANERQRLQNNLAVQAYINNDKNMELLMKRYNLSEAEFKERVRQFNVNAARADKKLSFDMSAFERQMQNWNTQYNQGVRQFNIRNYHDVKLFDPDATDFEPGSFQDNNSRFLRAVDYVFGLPFRNLK
nr:MAG: DNA pilot protein [Microvirus sp.]